MYNDESYWDDVYYEEHRNDYGGGYFKKDRSIFYLLENHDSPKNKGKEGYEENGGFNSFLDGLGAILATIILLTLGVLLAIVGICFLFVFPPLGILLIAPLFWMLGGR